MFSGYPKMHAFEKIGALQFRIANTRLKLLATFPAISCIVQLAVSVGKWEFQISHFKGRQQLLSLLLQLDGCLASLMAHTECALAASAYGNNRAHRKRATRDLFGFKSALFPLLKQKGSNEKEPSFRFMSPDWLVHEWLSVQS